jgi:hypothetical protein
VSESTTTASKPAADKPPEIDLKPFATVQVVRRTITRPTGPRKMENPFESIVRASYETAWEDEDGTRHEHGEPRITVPLRADSEEEKAVLRALVRAGRHVGCSVEKEFTDRDANGDKIRKPNRAILFSAVELKRRERKNGKPAEGEQASQPEGEQASQPEGEQASQPEGEQASQPEGEQVNQPEGEQQPAWS